MSGPDSPFRTELEQAIFEPKRKLVHEARTPNFPLREELMPAGVRLLGLDLVGRLPRDLILADDLKKTAKTTSETSVTLNLSTSYPDVLAARYYYRREPPRRGQSQQHLASVRRI